MKFWNSFYDFNVSYLSSLVANRNASKIKIDSIKGSTHDKLKNKYMTLQASDVEVKVEEVSSCITHEGTNTSQIMSPRDWFELSGPY